MFASLLTSLFWFFVFMAVVAVAVLFFKRPSSRRPENLKERINLSDDRILEGPEKTLGRGAFGVVAKYVLSSTSMSSAVAVKIPASIQHNASQEHEIAMLREAGSHANIINFMTSVWVKNKVYLVMELMQGTVTDLLKAYPKLSWPTKLSVVRQMLMGIVHLHALSNGTFTRKAMVHQDLKPENLLVDKIEDNDKIKVKLSDFGMARVVDEVKIPLYGKIATFHHEGPTGGTRQYMAPEIVKMLVTQDAGGCMRESDVFSVGVIMWEVATGHPPARNEHERLDGTFLAFKRDQAHCSIKEETTFLGLTKTVKSKSDYPKSRFFGPVIADCTQPKPSDRPCASKVLDKVQKIQLH